MDKFQEIINNPIYKQFHENFGKLAFIDKDGGDVSNSVTDLINLVKKHREQIINFFFVTWLASIEDHDLKKEILRSFFMKKVIVIEELFETSGFKMKISFECKQDPIDE